MVPPVQATGYAGKLPKNKPDLILLLSCQQSPSPESSATPATAVAAARGESPPATATALTDGSAADVTATLKAAVAQPASVSVQELAATTGTVVEAPRSAEATAAAAIVNGTAAADAPVIPGTAQFVVVASVAEAALEKEQAGENRAVEHVALFGMQTPVTGSVADGPKMRRRAARRLPKAEEACAGGGSVKQEGVSMSGATGGPSVVAAAAKEGVDAPGKGQVGLARLRARRGKPSALDGGDTAKEENGRRAAEEGKIVPANLKVVQATAVRRHKRARA